jgi:hypothetical protein
VSITHETAELVMNNFYNLLSGGNALNDFLAHCLCPYFFYKVFNDLEINISFKEGYLYLFKGREDIFFPEISFPF